MTNDILVSAIVFLPLIGILPVMLMPKAREQQIKWVTLGFMIVAFALGMLLLATYDPSNPNLQHVNKIPWISLGNVQINYYVGVDGLSLLLVLLTLLIMPLAVLFSLYSVKERIRLYYAFMLVLEFAMVGVFVAHDLFLFFVFWELSLIPMYFIVGIWGAEQRIYAALKLFLYTVAGSLLMLIAILYIGVHLGTFDVQAIISMVQSNGPGTSTFGGATVEGLLFLGFFAAFAVKVPLWPLHSWLPDAHVQAPTAGSVILAGVMLKLGTYGLIRFCLGFFPNAAIAFAPYIAVLAIIGIIYGAWVSYAQSDVKKLVAYSSISHLGFVVLGIFAIAKLDPNGFSAHATGLSGATLQMINHGISTGGLFLLVGMLYERRHTKAINAFGGIWKVLPIFSGLSLLITLSSMGLPGLNGFIGEFTILLGTFGSTILGPIFAAVATLGVILAAVYLLYMWNKVFMGEVTHDENNHLPPLRWNETLALVIVVIFALLIGLFPGPFFGTMDKSNQQLAANTARFIPNQNNQSARLEIGQGNTQ